MIATGLRAQILRFTLRAVDHIQLEQQPGSSIRGALFHALMGRFCAMPRQPSCAACPIVQQCPVAALIAPLRDEPVRGRDVPRPFVLRPPLIAAAQDGIRLRPGDEIVFSLTLFGEAIKLFPYIAMSGQLFEANGVGRPLPENKGKRGRFQIVTIDAVRTESQQTIYTKGSKAVSVMPSALTAASMRERAAQMPTDHLALRFLTPTRLVADGKIVHRPEPQIVLKRLAERLDAIEREYAPGGEAGRWRSVPDESTLALAGWDGRWIEVQSHSTRQGRATPISGFVGTARWEGEMSQAVRELLAWGEIIHVGKNTVKGDGWYELMVEYIH